MKTVHVKIGFGDTENDQKSTPTPNESADDAIHNDAESDGRDGGT